ncbi:SAM-dependent methyltransferase [Streptomyces sp. NPDC048362]|uniref:SAM-dependent methyltransferase n=1 Tax=Streptomyces sp. NPDC048362 TaxID=3365539 RepID=UPI00371940BB
MEDGAYASVELLLRSRTEVERFFVDLDLVEPGLTQVPFGHPDTTPPPRSARIGFYGGVGRKTA